MTPLLAVRDVTKMYGPRIGCADVSFDLHPGEVMGIVGESGSGKSTPMRMIYGSYLAASNRATVLALIGEAKARGAAIMGIFHAEDARSQVEDCEIDVSRFTPARAA